MSAEIVCWVLLALLLFYVVRAHMRSTTVASTALAAIAAVVVISAVAVTLRRVAGRHARATIAESSQLLRSLEGVTDPALSLLPLDEQLGTVLERTLAAVGGDVVSVLLLAANRKNLFVRASRGQADLAPHGDALAAGGSVLGDTAKWTRPVVIDDVPGSGLRPVEAPHRSVASIMATPLLVQGRAIGVVEVGSREHHQFGSDDVRLLQVAADRCAVVIEQARLHDSERRSRLGADHARLHLDLLARTGTVLASALDSYDGTLEELGRVLVPDFADWFAVDMLDATGELRRVTESFATSSFDAPPRDLSHGDHLVQRAIDERRPQVMMNTARIGSNDIDATVHAVPSQDGGPGDVDSMLVVPLMVRDKIPGALTFVTCPGRRGYRPSDLKTARELADRVGVAIERVASWRASQVAGNAALNYAERLQQLVAAGLVVNAQLAEEEVLELLAEHAHRVLAAEVVMISAQPGGGPLTEKVWPPKPGRDGTGRELLASVAAASEAVARSGLASRGPEDLVPGGPVGVPTAGTNGRGKSLRPARPVCWLAVPITGPEGECTRVVVALGTPGRRFSADDESVLTLLAQMASVALQNAQLYADVRSNERRLEAVVEASPLAIAELDLSGDARWWNRAAGELFGWNTGEGPRRVTVREGSELVLAELWERARGGKSTIGVAMSSSGPGGEQLELSVSTSPLGEQGQVTGMLLVADDVTEWRRILDQFHHAERLGAMTRMAGAVAHDFNNLLTVILGCSEVLLQRVKGDDALVEEVSAIQRAGSRAAALTSQLVGIGQQRPVQPEVLDVEEVIGSMQAMLSGVLGEGVTLQTVRGAGSARIHVDRSELERSVLNLAINARDAMPGGGRFVVETGLVDGAADGGRKMVQISFVDTGTGMEADTLAHCFEPFFTTKGRAQGTGLGLATVHAMVTQAGGEIRVDSTPGEGTRFTMIFPAHVAEVPDAATAQEDPSPMAGGWAGGGVVLMVDDEPEVLRLAVSELERSGYTVIGAANSTQALSAVNSRDGEIDLLVTDVVMPGMSGIELAEAVNRRYPDIPVLFVSGHLDEQVAGRTPLPSDAQLLPKPFTPDELSAWVRRALTPRSAPAARRARKGAAAKGSSPAVAGRRAP
jgi:PAS domain S-box-containing protein